MFLFDGSGDNRRRPPCELTHLVPMLADVDFLDLLIRQRLAVAAQASAARKFRALRWVGVERLPVFVLSPILFWMVPQ